MGAYKRGRPSKAEPPAKAGEYRWRNKKTNKVEYMGETANLKRRKRQHEKSPKPVSSETHFFEWQLADARSTSRTRRLHERQKIESKTPALNERLRGWKAGQQQVCQVRPQLRWAAESPV